MLVALELCGWLNDSQMALQAVVQCYGLLAPLVHYKIPSVPVVQVSYVVIFLLEVLLRGGLQAVVQRYALLAPHALQDPCCACCIGKVSQDSRFT